MKANSVHIYATLNDLVAAIGEVAQSLGVGQTVAVESEMLNALAVCFEELRVDGGSFDGLNNLPNHVSRIGQADLHGKLRWPAAISRMGKIGSIEGPDGPRAEAEFDHAVDCFAVIARNRTDLDNVAEKSVGKIDCPKLSGKGHLVYLPHIVSYKAERSR